MNLPPALRAIAKPHGAPQATPDPTIRPDLFVAIDPGCTESAYLIFDREAGRPDLFAKVPNAELLDFCRRATMPLVIERVASYGLAVGQEVFDTVEWAGRFREAAEGNGNPVTTIFRKEIKLHLCGNTRAKDPNIRAALIDRFGGKDAAIGRKAAKGPLYGVRADIWSALAIAVAYADRMRGPEDYADRWPDSGRSVREGFEQKPEAAGLFVGGTTR